MAKTKIEWTDYSWNPVSGCTPISEGCQNCYAKRMSKRLAGRCGYPADDPFRVTLHPDKLDEPLRWRKPRRVFVCSMGDLFHEDVPDEFIARVWTVMASCWKHTFLVLTKRPRRMLQWVSHVKNWEGWKTHNGEPPCAYGGNGIVVGYKDWPLPNVWLGVTAENRQRADERIPILLQIPAAVRFVSVEPMLGPVYLTRVICDKQTVIDPLKGLHGWPLPHAEGPKLDWVICGGETGPGARPMHPDWARSIRDQCKDAGVPFFLKSWGNWIEDEHTPICRVCGCTDEEACTGGCYWVEDPEGIGDLCNNCIGKPAPVERPVVFQRVGKKVAGRLLDGRAWDEMPTRGLEQL